MGDGRLLCTGPRWTEKRDEREKKGESIELSVNGNDPLIAKDVH